MLMLFALILVSIVVVAAIVYEIRSALFGLALSNGIEVLVSREMYWSIVRRYQMDDEPDHRVRWDHAVLDIIRPVRPHDGDSSFALSVTRSPPQRVWGRGGSARRRW